MNLSKVSSIWAKHSLFRAAVDIGQLMLRNLVLLAISLVVASVVTSTLSRDQYGMYRFTTGVAASLAFFSLPGLKQVIMQEAAKGHHGVLSHALRFRLKASALYSAALLIVAGYYQFVARQTTLALCFAVVSCLFPLGSVLDSYQSYLLGRGNYALYSRLPVLVGIFTAFAMALTAWAVRDPVALLVAVGAAQVVLQIVAHAVALRTQPPLNEESSPSALQFGIGLSAVNALATISAQLGTILVGILLTMPQVAVLNIATMSLDKSKIMIGVLGEFFGPRVVSQSGPSLFRRANRVMLVYVSTVMAYALLMTAIVPILFRVFFPKYQDVIPLAILAIFSMLPSAPAAIMEMTMYSQERLNQMSTMRFAQFAFDLLVGFTLIHAWGVRGAILGRFLAGAFRTGMTLVFYLRNHRESLQATEQMLRSQTIQEHVA